MFGHQLLLAVAVAALAAASSALAQRICDGAAERLLAAAALGVAAAVIWTLLLGLGRLAGGSIVLALGPVLAWLVVLGLERARAVNRGGAAAGATSPWAGAWRGLAPAERVAVGAALGLLCGATVEVALQPGFGVDAVEYHLPTALGWLQSGRAGSAQLLTYDFPVGYYPLTTEVLETWLLGLSRSFAPMAALGPLTAALGALGLWRTLVVLGVSRLQTWLATVAFLALPTVLFGVNTTGPGTDLSAVSWLLCGSALAFGALPSPLDGPGCSSSCTQGHRPARPVLLAPAMVACGLGVGTKTTVAPLAVIVLVLVAWRIRASLRTAVAPLASAVLAALVVGVPWYLRNWIVHGWPLWPFSAGPVGDRLPHTMQLFSASFLSRPRVTFDYSPGAYLKNAGGGVVMMAGAVIAPLLARRRSVLAAAIVAVVALLAWAQAPFTGLSGNPLLNSLAITTVRYILSALCACLLAISLLARPANSRPASRPAHLGAALITVAAIVWSLIADHLLGYPAIPRAAWPLALGALGGLLVLAAIGAASFASPLGARYRPIRRPAPIRPAAWIAAVLAIAAASALAAPGWVTREARDGDSNAAVTAFMLTQPGWVGSDVPVSFAPAEISTLAGARLNHRLELIPADESCAATLARLGTGWIVLRPSLQGDGILPTFRAAACLAHVHPLYDDGTTVVYGPGGL